jgi:hypothetical protein
LPPEYHFRYVAEDEKDEYLRDHIDRSFRGKITDEYTIAEQSLWDLLLRPLSCTVLVKWVRLCLSLDWIAKHFPGVTVVQIVRHPVPLFLSWKTRDWDPGHNLQLLLCQEGLMKGRLAPYVTIMTRAQSYWEKAAALWGAINFMQWKAHRPHWIFRLHEWYCYNPENRIRWLAENLGLIWTKESHDFLRPDRKILRGPGYGRKRDSRSEIDKWRGKIGSTEIKQIHSVLKEFNLPYFRGTDPDQLFKDPHIIDTLPSFIH